MFVKNNFAGFQLPTTDLKAFENAMLQQDLNGNTLMDKKRAELTLEQRTFIDYMVYKDFKVTGLSPKQATTKSNFDFKDLASKNKNRKARLAGAGDTTNSSTNKTTPGHPTIQGVQFQQRTN